MVPVVQRRLAAWVRPQDVVLTPLTLVNNVSRSLILDHCVPCLPHSQNLPVPSFSPSPSSTFPLTCLPELFQSLLHSSGLCPHCIPANSSLLLCSACPTGQSMRGHQGQAYCPWFTYLELALTLKNRGKEKNENKQTNKSNISCQPHKLFHNCTIARSCAKGEFRKCSWGSQRKWGHPFWVAAHS